MFGFAHCCQSISCDLLSTRLGISNNLGGICNGLLQAGFCMVNFRLSLLQQLVTFQFGLAEDLSPLRFRICNCLPQAALSLIHFSLGLLQKTVPFRPGFTQDTRSFSLRIQDVLEALQLFQFSV
ncbi:hypothetical protein D3C77_431170 [compost metagenome]